LLFEQGMFLPAYEINATYFCGTRVNDENLHSDQRPAQQDETRHQHRDVGPREREARERRIPRETPRPEPEREPVGPRERPREPRDAHEAHPGDQSAFVTEPSRGCPPDSPQIGLQDRQEPEDEADAGSEESSDFPRHEVPDGGPRVPHGRRPEVRRAHEQDEDDAIARHGGLDACVHPNPRRAERRRRDDRTGEQEREDEPVLPE